MHLTSKKRIRHGFSLETSTLLVLLIAASCVKSRHAVISMTHRLTWPSFLDSRAMSRPGAHFPADGRIEDGGCFLSPPLHSGGEAERSFAVKAQALARAVRAPGRYDRHRHAGARSLDAPCCCLGAAPPDRVRRHHGGSCPHRLTAGRRRAAHVPHKGRATTDAARWGHGLRTTHDASLAAQGFCHRSHHMA